MTRLARNTDPSTSHAAAAAVGSLKEIHHWAIITAMKSRGRPLAAEEVSDNMGGYLDKVQVAKRWHELVEDGFVFKTNQQHRNRSGRKAFRYALVTQ